MTPATVRVAAAQVAADVTQAPTAERLVEAVRAAAAKGADLVVLPELAPSGYCFRDREEARAAAEPLDGPIVSTLRRVSRELTLEGLLTGSTASPSYQRRVPRARRSASRRCSHTANIPAAETAPTAKTT